MSAVNPVESKVETAAKVVDAAAALAGAPAPTEVAKTGWWAVRNPKRFGVVAGGAVLAVAVGSYGWKYLNTAPPKVVAQAETGTSPTPPAKAEEPAKPEKNLSLDLELPDVTSPKPAPRPGESTDPPPPAVRTPDKPAPKPAESDLLLRIPEPSKPASKPGTDNDPPLIRTPDVTAPKIPDSNGPAVKSPTSSDPAPLVLPPTPPVNGPENKKPMADPDLFRAPEPAPLPTAVSDRKDKPANADSGPVIRIGGMGDPLPPIPKPPAGDPPPPPPAPLIDINPPSPPNTKKDPAPAPGVPKVDVPSIKIDEPLTIPAPRIGPSPTIDTPPSKDPPPLLIPESPRPPAPGIDTPRPPVIDVTPAPPVAPKPEKKDMYEEDWHPQREGDTYTMIAKEYLKDAKYSAALEAYNKERKSGERIVRVPPPWVLEEQFPNLIGDKPGTVEAKPTSNPTFEAVTPKPGSERPAPPPSSPVSTSDEYRVKLEAGETIKEIARKVYGNPDSWRKLFELNPNLDVTAPIPAGTIIRLGK